MFCAGVTGEVERHRSSVQRIHLESLRGPAESQETCGRPQVLCVYVGGILGVCVFR